MGSETGLVPDGISAKFFLFLYLSLFPSYSLSFSYPDTASHSLFLITPLIDRPFPLIDTRTLSFRHVHRRPTPDPSTPGLSTDPPISPPTPSAFGHTTSVWGASSALSYLSIPDTTTYYTPDTLSFGSTPPPPPPSTPFHIPSYVQARHTGTHRVCISVFVTPPVFRFSFPESPIPLLRRHRRTLPSLYADHPVAGRFATL